MQSILVKLIYDFLFMKVITQLLQILQPLLQAFVVTWVIALQVRDLSEFRLESLFNAIKIILCFFYNINCLDKNTFKVLCFCFVSVIDGI